MQLKEVFNSISGECSPFLQGCFTTFVRFPTCNLKCSYCDTDLTSDPVGVSVNTIDELFKKTGKLCITGGEPLLNPEYVKYLCSRYLITWIETNGTIDFTEYLLSSWICTDYKLSYMKGVIPDYFWKLRTNDFVKFVIEDRGDFTKALEIQKVLQRGGLECMFAYSPCHTENYSGLTKELFSWLENDLPPRTIINTQIHKFLGMK